MSWTAIGSAVAGGIVDGAFGAYNTSQANSAAQTGSLRQFLMQQMLMDKQNEYNKPINQRARLREANMNPALAYGGVSGNTSASPSGGASQQVFKNNADLKFVERMKIAQDIKAREADISNVEASTKRTVQQTDLDALEFDLKRRYINAQINYLTGGTALRQNELAYYTSVDSALRELAKELGADDADTSGSSKLLKEFGLPLLGLFVRRK